MSYTGGVEIEGASDSTHTRVAEPSIDLSKRGAFADLKPFQNCIHVFGDKLFGFSVGSMLQYKES